MPMLVCGSCDRHAVWGVLSAQSWLEHRNGDGPPAHICPSCAGAMTEQQREAFLESGAQANTRDN